jgi:TolB protein
MDKKMARILGRSSMLGWTLRWGWWLFAGIAATSLLIVSLTGRHQPFGGSTGLLAVEIGHDPEFAPYISDLYLLDVLTGEAHPLFPLHDGHDYSLPAWSPDGRTLAYHYLDQGRWGLWMYNPSSGDAHLITPATNPTHRPVWSPDGQEIALLTSPRRFTLLTVADGTLSPVPDQGQDTDRYSSPFWLATGQLVVSSYRNNQLAGFLLINPASGVVSTPTRTGLEGQLIDTAWSHEPNRLAALFRPANAVELMLISELGHAGEMISLPATLMAYPSWSPDGRFLTLTEFDSDTPGYSRLYLLDLQRRLSRRLTDWVYAGWQNPSWQPVPSL